ncbi:hypothetical protein GOV08_05060 [Candidatus Woesearchaeota archaeon]|nr:hypothetical protein [Candidatus Woesearchaeota archaeon]
MNLVVFLMMLALFFAVLYIVYIIFPDKEGFSKKYLWGFCTVCILFAAIFNGIIDKIFISIFSSFIIFSKAVMGVWQT